MNHTYSVIYYDFSKDSFPLVFTTSAEDKFGAPRAFRLNKGGLPVYAVVKLPNKSIHNSE